MAGVHFYPWCVGQKKPFEGNTYTAGHREDAFIFKSLREIMMELGHARLDILKMDIEGFEWTVLEQEVLPLAMTTPPQAAPLQLLFELHTEGANPRFVPQGVVKGRGRAAVNALFLSLLEAGYRVVSKEINGGDLACAEFSLVKL